MGIQGLLPLLKKASRPAHLREFKGQTATIDAYCWLHKGAFSCADKLVRGEPTDGYVLYVMKQVSLLLNHDIKPILVFDGCHLPSKAVTESKRRENRERNRKKAKELLREGKTREARECFQRCVDITSEMAAEVIAACRARNVDIIVAPYEADAQLAYLHISGLANLVITEDSDLILFGCKNILFKMDSNGNGILVEQEKLHLGMNLPRDKFAFDKFRNMCILSGCDYLPSLHGIGLVKACKFFSVTSNPDIHSALCKLPTYLKMPHLEVNQEYRDGFIKARNTFLYQLVFDPTDRKLKPLNEYPDGMGAEDFPYAGKFIGHERALQIALGNVNVQSGEMVNNFDPDHHKPPEMKSSGWDKRGNVCTNHNSIWKQDYIPTKPHLPVPSLGVWSGETTRGKEVIIPVNLLRRKRVAENEPSTTDITEGELQNMYCVPEKKLKVEEHLCDMKTSQDDTHDIENKDALDFLSEALDEDDYEEAAEDPGHSDVEAKSVEDLPTESCCAKKSKNPFAKAQSPRKMNSLPAKQFSALKSFSKIRKTIVDSDTLIHSRYFSSPTSVSSKPSIAEVEKDVSISALNDVIGRKDDKKDFEYDGKLVKEENSEAIPSDSGVIKAPLSPVQTNTLSVKTEKTFKWGKLSDMFSYKPKDTFEIGSSPATKGSFKLVKPSSKSSPSTARVSKENDAFSSSPFVDTKPLPLSQQSYVSEASCLSDIGSVDNESFGLTPSTPPDHLLSSSLDKCDELPLSQERSRVSPILKSSTSHHVSTSQRGISKARPVGLSRPRGKAGKVPDPRQRNLRDMFGFKKN